MSDAARVVCDYCGAQAKLVTGREMYPYRPDLFKKRLYECKPCDAYVGTHENSGKPLGRLANKKLRGLKMQVHAKFDPIWKSGKMTRKKAYRWLSDGLCIKQSECHVGMFDEDTCEKALAFIQVTTGVDDE